MKTKEIKLFKIISKNKHDSIREVILTDGKIYQTKHIYKKAKAWLYFDHKDNKGKPIYKPIAMERG